MKILKTPDYYHMSRVAANILSAQVIMKPDCVLGLATGSTPIGAYEQLCRWYEKGDIDFSQVKSVNLDEYAVGYMWGTLGIIYDPTCSETIKEDVP